MEQLRRIPALIWGLVLVVGVYVLLKYVVQPPVPGQLLTQMYVPLLVIAILLHFSVREGGLDAFFAPLQELFAEGQPQPMAPVKVGEGVTCTQCQAVNIPGKKFCTQCGTPLPVPTPCPNCGTTMAPGKKFCTECGTPMSISDFGFRIAE
ncbi:MAG: zinc ribbon domain-containing protein [Anaerolineae bacterium]